MDFLVEFLVSATILIGALVALIGALGLARLPDFYLRLHGPSKSSTLGVGGCIMASLLFFSWREQALQLQEVLIMLFLFITAPVSAQMLAKAAMHRGAPCREDTKGRPWKQ